MDFVALDLLRNSGIENFYFIERPVQDRGQQAVGEGLHAFEILQCIDYPGLFLWKRSVVRLANSYIGSARTIFLSLGHVPIGSLYVWM